MNDTTKITAEQLNNKFDELSADINDLLRRYRRIKEDREALLAACKQALPYLETSYHPGDDSAYERMADAITQAEVPLV